MASEPPAPRERNSESNYTNLYIKYFPQAHGEEELEDLFGGYGPIQALKVMTDPRGRKSAFVNFEQHKDACECVKEMHRRDLRPRAERKAAEKAEKAGKPQPVITDNEGHPENLLFVGRAQSKAERQALLQKQFGGKGGVVFTPSSAANSQVGGKGGCSTPSSSTSGGKGGGNKEVKSESDSWPQQPHRNVAAQGGGKGGSNAIESNGWSQQSHCNFTASAQGAVPASALSLATQMQNDYSTNHTTRAPASCSFQHQQNLQHQRWNQQQWNYNQSSAGYYDARDDGYGCSGGAQCDSSYAGTTNGYGQYSESEGDGTYGNYGWGTYGNGTFSF